jgi:polyisoprenoid-binding protein YceI
VIKPALAVAALLALAVGAAPARASHFSAHAGSSLQFTAAYQGEAFTGRFTRFEAAIRFDPDNLAGSRLDVRIPLASARTDNAERDDMLVGPEFFDAGAMPEARYEATRVVKLKDGRFRADGTLTLRGVSKPVPLLFTWTAGAMPTLTGEAIVNRLDFGVGTGDWEDLELIPNRVKVSTRLVLGPQARVKVPEAATK